MALPCPSCKTPLGLTLEFIMKNPTCVCPSCKTRFSFNITEDIKKIYTETITEINKIKRQYKGTVKFS